MKVAIEAWLETHGLVAVERDNWEVPSADDVKEVVSREEIERPERKNRFVIAEANRKRLQELVGLLPVRELESAIAFLEFLRERRHLPRVTSKISNRSMHDVNHSDAEDKLEPNEDDS